MSDVVSPMVDCPVCGIGLWPTADVCPDCRSTFHTTTRGQHAIVASVNSITSRFPDKPSVDRMLNTFPSITDYVIIVDLSELDTVGEPTIGKLVWLNKLSKETKAYLRFIAPDRIVDAFRPYRLHKVLNLYPNLDRALNPYG